jgi:hypothetical protein
MAAASLLETDGNHRVLDRRGRPVPYQSWHIEVLRSFGGTMLSPVHDSLLIDRSRNHG